MLLGLSLGTAIVIPVAIFIAFGAITWLVLSHFFNGREDRAEQRLQELSDPRQRANADARKSDSFARALRNASPALAKPLTPTTEAEMSKLKQSLVEAGFRTESAPLTFLAIRTKIGRAHV